MRFFQSYPIPFIMIELHDRNITTSFQDMRFFQSYPIPFIMIELHDRNIMPIDIHINDAVDYCIFYRI
jgi:hypothetical protein